MSFNIAEIVSITSESLQRKIRQLLPSQQGFGADLQASNVIVPIIDLTATAEGAGVGTDLQTALAFGSQTAFTANNSTDVIANSPGFYRIVGNAVTRDVGSGVTSSNSLTMSDGLSVKTIWEQSITGIAASPSVSAQVDYVVFLRSGDSISAVSDSVHATFDGSSRQIADVNGNLVNPVGFNPQ